VVDGAGLGLLDDLGCLFERVEGVLIYGLVLSRWGDSLGLVEVEGIAPADEGYPGGATIAAQHKVPVVIPLLEELVVDDWGGFLALLDLPSKVVGLLEGQPVGGLKVTASQD